jgi:hypothetical protein
MPNARRRSRVTGGSLAVCFALSLFALPPIAQAFVGEYDVEVCTPHGNARGHGLDFLEQGTDPERPPVNLLLTPCEGAGEPALGALAFPGLVAGLVEWNVTAPAGALIRSIQGNRMVSVTGSNIGRALRWFAFPDDPLAPEMERISFSAPPADGPFTWTPVVPTPVVHARLVCQSALGCENEEREEQVFFTGVVAHVVDQSPPTVSTAGPLLAGGPMRGAREIGFKASDRGGGVARVSLVVDGNAVESKTDANQGLCAMPYRAMAPCPTELDSSFVLDTTALAEGRHEVRVVVEDASGQTVGSAATVDVHNRPLNTGRPTISGAARVGQSLTAGHGQWDGSPSSFEYQWLRCPAGAKLGEEGSCAPVTGANRDVYQAVDADVGKSLVVEVTANNRFGSEAAFSASTPPIAGSAGPPGGDGSPQTRIVKHPRRRTSARIARFAFRSDQRGSRFQCRLDRAAFRPCRSPFKRRRKLKPGFHSFRVQAINASGAVDPTPARFRWKVLR